MAVLIGQLHTGNYGEDYFIKKALEYLDDTYVIYRNRQIYGKEFDVCILMPNKGVLVVELKGWREETILRVEADEILLDTDDGEVKASPQKQARGYRFTLQRFLKNKLAINPLVFQMVCLPQVSKEYYYEKRLDIVSEEKFTILKEDLESNTSFYKKLDEALREANYWYRDPFDRETMQDVRGLFEPDYKPEKSIQNRGCIEEAPANPDYSRFYFFQQNDPQFLKVLKELAMEYERGCKLYCIFTEQQQLTKAVEAIDQILEAHGLVRNRDNLEINFDGNSESYPSFREGQRSFSAFHCAFSVIRKEALCNINSFSVSNGQVNEKQKQELIYLDSVSDFNSSQFFIEHAPSEKNIVIKAGAGTGKTFTMISRIAFICYSQDIPLSKMADRITMITFTNEAADSMEEKLKSYFRNCYLLTSNIEYLNMISLIDQMQISTIHSYAKHIITKLGTEFGYGVDLAITSSEFSRSKKIAEYLDSYIIQREREFGNYTSTLGLPVYEVRNLVSEIISKLNNKSVDVSALSASAFGDVSDANWKQLHQLLAEVIPAVEREFNGELLENNRIHLSSMMSVLHNFICSRDQRKRLSELKEADIPYQFLFVDEFQDTDDEQIDVLLRLAEVLNFRLFLVGDIKQCIYRFRGAKEKAFDQVGIEDHPDQWLEFVLQRNYRTDRDLLDIFHASFAKWGARGDDLLAYSADKDRLLGTREYNSYLQTHKEKYYHCTSVRNEGGRIKALVDEIRRIQNRINFEESRGVKLSKVEKSIAILVRENWQADVIHRECKKYNIDIQTNTGGDLFSSQPALDMLTLVNALLHFDEAEYLYNLATSNFFNLDLPKAALYDFRARIRSRWRAKQEDQIGEIDLVNYLIDYLNAMLGRIDGRDGKWEYVVHWLRTKPVLQALRDLYDYLQPWKNFNPDNVEAQRYYQINVDLLFEYLINSCNIDRLTINTLQEHLYSSIVSHVAVDSRKSQNDQEDSLIQCLTVHKSKGLEYGHVILPYCSFPIDKNKKAKVHVSTEKQGDMYQIGYRIAASGFEPFQNSNFNESLEAEERKREETRILYVAMTRAIRSFSWIEVENNSSQNWQYLIEKVR